jgi:hypothetical protein
MLMAKVNAILELGGWSDAIHRDAMQPSLTITPLGDVQVPVEFESTVVMPFSLSMSQSRVNAAIEDYEMNFQSPEVRETDELDLDPGFLSAWHQEFGFTLQDLRVFLDTIEDEGTRRASAVFLLMRNELVALLESKIEKERVESLLNALSLCPRESWRTLPEGFGDEKDIQPWRFRRQLSAIRRPVFQMDSGNDSVVVLAPGFVRESANHLISGYYEGSFPDRQYRSKPMRSWYGRRVSQRGSEFAELVVGRTQELGWNGVKREVDVREIIGCTNDPDFGDLRHYGDVDVLAWNEVAKRVLVIECKHLHFHKTVGEIAEQLSDYRGRLKPNGKRDDLRKHLDRLEILNARKAALCAFIGVDSDIQIEGWILFKHSVPMLYAWKELEAKTKIATCDDLERVLNSPE